MSGQKPCHNCRRRRRRCDRSVPACYKCSQTGQKCLGYGKLYRWVDSETPSEPAQSQKATSTSSTGRESWLINTAHSKELNYDTTVATPQDDSQQTLNICLADPLLQDLSSHSRYYLSYFATRFCQDLVVHDSAEKGTNPFRELIPMSQTYSYLQHIIIAVSAVHHYHAISNAALEVGARPHVARNSLVDALYARQRAIRELITIIDEKRAGRRRAESQADQDALLATVLFFVNFTLIDCGKFGWRDHLTAAGKLLSVYVPPTTPVLLCAGDDQVEADQLSPSTPDPADFPIPSTSLGFPEAENRSLTACDYVTSDIIAYFIWNCAVESLVSKSVPSSPHDHDYAAQPLTWDVAQVLKILSRTEANSYHSCPAHLMGVVLRIARIAQHLKANGIRSPPPPQMDAYLSLLKEAETFDVEAWATGVSTHIIGMLGVMNEHELRLRCHIGFAYRAAVCLYVLLVAPGLPAEIRRRARLSGGGGSGDTDGGSLPSLPTTAELALTILQQLSFIPKTSPLFKYTVWPVFLTGVDAVSDTHRLWVTERLRAMRDVCPWSMMTSAMETLAEIWQLRDNAVRCRVEEEGMSVKTPEVEAVDEDGDDWLAKLRGLRIDCLIV